MGRLACVSLHRPAKNPEQDFRSSVDHTRTWLKAKNVAVVDWRGSFNPPPPSVAYGTRDVAFERAPLVTEAGLLTAWRLEETQEDVRFVTTITLAVAQASQPTAVVWHCVLHAERASSIVAPTRVDVRVPRIVQSLVGEGGWYVGSSEVARIPLRFRGKEGGQALAATLTSTTRSLPVVAVSDLDGLLLHPDILDCFAADLAGVGLVAHVDSEAAWHLGKELGSSLSCYHGAIRVYWPGQLSNRDPFRHPLWTAYRLTLNEPDTVRASQRIRGTVRRMILDASALGTREPKVVQEIKAEARLEEFRRMKLDAKQSVDDLFRELESQHEAQRAYEEQLTSDALLENSRLTQEVERLRADVTNLQFRLSNYETATSLRPPADTTQSDLIPETEVPPETVADAVKKARQHYGAELVFGSQTTSSVGELAANAGPPQKVLEHLKTLARMARELRRGPLGTSIPLWLKKFGVEASGETEATLANKAKAEARTWDAGGSRVVFDLHTKPNEATAPDKCVRIYFRWDPLQQKVAVGWIGRHPD